MVADRNFNVTNLKSNSYGEDKHYQQFKAVVWFACPYAVFFVLNRKTRYDHWTGNTGNNTSAKGDE